MLICIGSHNSAIGIDDKIYSNSGLNLIVVNWHTTSTFIH